MKKCPMLVRENKSEEKRDFHLSTNAPFCAMIMDVLP